MLRTSFFSTRCHNVTFISNNIKTSDFLGSQDAEVTSRICDNISRDSSLFALYCDFALICATILRICSLSSYWHFTTISNNVTNLTIQRTIHYYIIIKTSDIDRSCPKNSKHYRKNFLRRIVMKISNSPKIIKSNQHAIPDLNIKDIGLVWLSYCELFLLFLACLLPHIQI